MHTVIRALCALLLRSFVVAAYAADRYQQPAIIVILQSVEGDTFSNYRVVVTRLTAPTYHYQGATRTSRNFQNALADRFLSATYSL